jgi:hypothetical protein
MAANKDRDNDEHFTGQGDCNIHTSRSHSTCKTTLAAKGNCDHQTNCAKLPVTWKQKGAAWIWENEWESHHVLCVGAVNRYMTLKAYAKSRANIDAIYRATKWCINQEPNLIALPMKKVYNDYAGSLLSLNRPCHEWDHNVAGGYTDEVTQAIHLNVWDKIKEVEDEKKQCELAKSVVVKEFDRMSDEFEQELRDRGERPVGAQKGTRAAWEESQKKSPAKRADNWWFSFSMAKNSVAAGRPALSFGVPKWASAKDRLRQREELREVREKG